jgi:hypothetical protein
LEEAIKNQVQDDLASVYQQQNAKIEEMQVGLPTVTTSLI